MGYQDVLNFQEDMVKKHKYKALPPLFREEVLQFYTEQLPENFCINGARVPLYTSEGLKLCNGYNRIVIGDYGAYVEILPDDIINENVMVKKGQEYRDFDERYSKHTKYSWLTSKDGADVKIYFQKKPVDYADYVPGRYYISPYECSPQKTLDKACVYVDDEAIMNWLKEQGVYSGELFDYFVSLNECYGDELYVAVEKELEPARFEYWVKLTELVGKMSFEQFEAVEYNLDVIKCSSKELFGSFESLSGDVKCAIQMGLDRVEFPFEVQELSSDEVRGLLKLDAHTLFVVARFCKVVSGCKAELLVKDDFGIADVNKLIDDAKHRIRDVAEKEKEYDLVF